MNANLYQMMDSIGTNVVTLIFGIIPLLIVIAAERKRPFSWPGAVAAGLMMGVSFLANGICIGAFASGLMIGSIAYYIAERVTRKRS